MMDSTIKTKICYFAKKSLGFILPVVLWLLIWEIIAINVDNNFLLPDIKSTFDELTVLLGSTGFYTSVGLSALRVIIGFLFGLAGGILLGALCCRFFFMKSMIEPMIIIIKSTPVASFILLLWVYFSGNSLPVFIGSLMVLPIIWQSVIDGYNSIDKDLIEVADIFEFSRTRRLKILIIPSIKKFLTPAIIIAGGLAWKAEIAAEIISYTKKSIGQGINDARYELNTPVVFAWTIIIILLSIILEKFTKWLLRKAKE